MGHKAAIKRAGHDHNRRDAKDHDAWLPFFIVLRGFAAAVSAWMDRMVPHALDEKSEVRARFFVRAWMVALGFAAFSTLFFGVHGLWPQVWVIGQLLVAGPALLVLHRRGSSFEPLVHASLAAVSFAFGLGALTDVPTDHTSLGLLLLVPMLATFLLGKRGGVTWLFLGLIWGGFVSSAEDHGWIVGAADPYPIETHLVNFGMGIVLAWLFAQTFDSVREEANERLIAADRLRRTFLANVSHEIRTPMNGVLGMTEVMLQDQLSPQHREQLATIQRSGRNLVSLIDGLLDLAKMEAGKLSLEEVDFDLDALLADISTLAGATARSKGLELKVERNPEVPSVLRGDGMRLGQVLTNLVGNAIKFTSSGQIRLEIRRVQSAVGVGCSFAVTDSGPGIAAEAQARLFSPFEQADSTTTRKHGGTGLGLALSQRIVSRMGGHIEVDSKPGVGSRFSFTIVFGEAGARATAHLASEAPHASHRTALVVDDNAINLKVAEALCEKAGFIVQTATSGREAVAAVERQRFSIVLLDVHMPEMDGLEVARRIRSLGSTPIVGLTGSAMPEELSECLRAGMNAVLTKPVTFVVLKRTLEQFARGEVTSHTS